MIDFKLDFNRYKPKQVYTFDVDINASNMSDEDRSRIRTAIRKVGVVKTPITTVDDGVLGYGLWWRSIPLQDIDSRKITITFEETDDMLITQYFAEKLAWYKNSVLSLMTDFNFNITLTVYNEYKIGEGDEAAKSVTEYCALLTEVSSPTFSRTGNVDKLDITATFLCVPRIAINEYAQQIVNRREFISKSLGGIGAWTPPPQPPEQPEETVIMPTDNGPNKPRPNSKFANNVRRGSAEDTFEYRLSQYKKHGGRFARAYSNVADDVGIDSTSQNQIMKDVIAYMNRNNMNRNDLRQVSKAMENMGLISGKYSKDNGGLCATITGIALEIAGGASSYKAHGHGGQWGKKLETEGIGKKVASVGVGNEGALQNEFNKLEKDKSKVYVASVSYGGYGHVSYTYWDGKSWVSKSDFNQAAVISNSNGQKGISNGAIYELSSEDLTRLV